ncbi:6-phosphofructokinase 2 [Spatholobus suberectus]|nr:6-phosphofructokinase 2 [Spatholobus suberectus]
MKQKIVIKVQMDCDKCRSKALKIAAVTKGVSSVSLEGEERDEVVVTGNEIDLVCLAKALRKKFHYANILKVEEVKDKDKDKKEEETKLLPIPLSYYYGYYPPCPPSVACEYPDASNCIVM